MNRPRLELVWTRYANGAESPFDALLDAAERDAEAAEGLALAYAALDRDERDALYASVLRDAEDRDRSPAGILALLLAVEEDEELANRMARAILGAVRPACESGRALGWAWGSTDEGGVAFAGPPRGDRLPLSSVRWQGEHFEVVTAEPVAGHQLEEGRRRLALAESAEAMAFDEAVDLLAAQLWRARRTFGPLPESLRAIVRVLTPY